MLTAGPYQHMLTMPGIWLSSASTASLVVHFGRARLVGVLTWGGGLVVPVDCWVRPLAN
jgi:hypothetical protein